MAIYTKPDSYTKLLIHSDDANDGTSIVDSSSSPHTLTRNGALHKTAYSKFGGSSLFFDGSNDSLTTTTSFTFGTGDFTVDYWTYFVSFYNWITQLSTTRSDNGFNCGTDANGMCVWFCQGRMLETATGTYKTGQ